MVMLGIISKYMGTLPVPIKKKKPAVATKYVQPSNKERPQLIILDSIFLKV